MTPALVVRREALLSNVRVMQDLCDAAGVRLRPHGKMHKCSTLARLQIEAGATGLCCQTVGEAEAFFRAGLNDLLITAPVAPWGAPRIATLAQYGARISVVADDPRQIEWLELAAANAGAEISVLVDIDLGQHRTGCFPQAAAGLAIRIGASAKLRFRGIQAYLGHLQHEPDPERRRSANAAATERLKDLVEQLRRVGLPPAVVTGGGTGTYGYDLADGAFTELQAGSYALMDVEYENCGSPGGGEWPFQSALFIATSVVSAQHKTHVTVDAGLKAIAVDGPAPRVYAGAPAGSTWISMGDEHGAIIDPGFVEALARAADPLLRSEVIDSIDADRGFSAPVGNLRPGDLVWLQPGHCDPTVNLYDGLLVVDEDGALETWPIDARRTSTGP